MAGKGGGAWKVAYADFVTAMMAFFMVMWITSQSDEVKAAVSRHFSGPFKPINNSGLYEPLFSNGHDGKQPDSSLELDDEVKNGLPGTSAKHEAPKTPTTGWGTVKGDHSISHVAGEGPGGAHRGEEKGDASLATFHMAGANAALNGQTTKAIEDAVFKMYGRSNAVEIRTYVPRTKPGAQNFEDWKQSQEKSLKIKSFLEERGISPARIRLTQIVGDPLLDGEAEENAAASTKNNRVEIVMHVEPVKDTAASAGSKHGGGH